TRPGIIRIRGGGRWRARSRRRRPSPQGRTHRAKIGRPLAWVNAEGAAKAGRSGRFFRREREPNARTEPSAITGPARGAVGGDPVAQSAHTAFGAVVDVRG